ncbi:response regulator transcription factor [Actinocorallia sp. A-T 12471]|uniref:winged helix-turn-helix transcriptional regulator n=1 Tax=Actinocorallia sp. A-T 12471 TaxID=3089813 RepID=UPI0029D32D64|nr:response regulator transcription factor [Actinocorallia sp. A-T 12471]MDX6743030.1 response regulator transcription factor [Actinocorallia sp. A-T 12471]
MAPLNTDAPRPPEPGGTVLVFEHDPDVAELQRLYLTRAGYRVVVEADRAHPADAIARVAPDAVVLDLSALPPQLPAAELYRRVADAARPAPVIRVLPPSRSEAPGERAVVRPFSPRALVAAVSAALRAHAEDTAADVLRAGALVLDPRTRSVRAGDRPATLTATEFDLLAHLLRHPGRVFTREQLLAAAWSPGGGAGVRTVDVHVAQLRAKLGPASPIRTVRGVGYAADI